MKAYTLFILFGILTRATIYYRQAKAVAPSKSVAIYFCKTPRNLCQCEMLKDDFYMIVQAHHDSAPIVTPIFKIYALKLPEQSLSLHLVTCWNTHLTVGIPSLWLWLLCKLAE